MMLVNGCVLVIILSFGNILLCVAEEVQEETTSANIATTPANITADISEDMPTIAEEEQPTEKDNGYDNNGINYNIALKGKIQLSRGRKRTNRTKLLDRRPYTTHKVSTSDDYILTIFRLTQKTDGDRKRNPVLLVPGLYQSADRFLIRKIDQNLAYTLQDKGYDVWLLNPRGNKYSREHAKYNPEENKDKFFKYTLFEIGYFDLPATVDFILETTGLKKINYIGHSLGGTYFLILNSLLPEYNDKFNRAYLMAPLSYQTHFPNEYLKKEFEDPATLYKDLNDAKVNELFPHDYIVNDEFVTDNCLGMQKYKDLCGELNLEEIMDLLHYHNPDMDTRGGSVQLLVHLAQNIKDEKFRRFDFGQDNQKVYGEGDLPEYDLSKITVLTQIIYAPTDEMVGEQDIKELAKKMGNASTRIIERRNFGHADFITGKKVMQDVFNGIIEDLPESVIDAPLINRKGRNIGENNGKVNITTDDSADLLPGFAVLIIALNCHFLMHLYVLM